MKTKTERKKGKKERMGKRETEECNDGDKEQKKKEIHVFHFPLSSFNPCFRISMYNIILFLFFSPFFSPAFGFHL